VHTCNAIGTVELGEKQNFVVQTRLEDLEVDPQGPIFESEYVEMTHQIHEPLVEKTILYLRCLHLYSKAEVHFVDEEILSE
jgi:hypothetical protein